MLLGSCCSSAAQHPSNGCPTRRNLTLRNSPEGGCARLSFHCIPIVCHTLGLHNSQECVVSICFAVFSATGPPQPLEFPPKKFTPVILNTPPWAQYFNPLLLPSTLSYFWCPVHYNTFCTVRWVPVRVATLLHCHVASNCPHSPTGTASLPSVDACRRAVLCAHTPVLCLLRQLVVLCLCAPVLNQHEAHLVLWALHTGGAPLCHFQLPPGLRGCS